MNNMLYNMHNMHIVNMQNNMKNDIQNMHAICSFVPSCFVLTVQVICKTCKIICLIWKICGYDFQYYADLEHASPTSVLTRMTWLPAWGWQVLWLTGSPGSRTRSRLGKCGPATVTGRSSHAVTSHLRPGTGPGPPGLAPSSWRHLATGSASSRATARY